MEPPFNKQPGDKTFTLRFTDGNIEMHKRNTSIYQFKRHSRGEHIYIAAGVGEEDGVMTGSYFWKRGMLESQYGIEGWERIVKQLGRIGCNTIVEYEMSEHDHNAYVKRFGERVEDDFAIPTPQEVAEYGYPDQRELTPHQENLVSWLRYLLENNHITPPDFDTEHGVIL